MAIETSLLLEIKAILESQYFDDITTIPRAEIDDAGDIIGIFEDKISSQVTKRYAFKITDDQVGYKLINQDVVASFQEDEDEDPPDLYSKQAIASAAPLMESWITRLEETLFEGAESLEEVRDRVESAYPELDTADFAEVMQNLLLAGYGAGRYQVLEETTSSEGEKVELSELDIEKASVAQQWLKTIDSYKSLSPVFNELAEETIKLNFTEEENLVLTYAEIGRRFADLVLAEQKFLLGFEETIDFAAKKTKGKERTCKTGFPCGNSCISRTKTCRNTLEGQYKTAAEWLESQTKKLKTKEVEKPSPPPARVPATAKEFIELGESLIPGKLRSEITQFKNGGSKERKRLQAEYDAAKEETITGLDRGLSDRKMAPIFKRLREKEQAYFDLERSERQQLENSMEDFRQKLITDGSSRQEATRLADGIEYDPSYRDGLSNKFSEKDLRDSTIEFYQLTGGKGGSSVKQLIKDDDRGYAIKSRGLINIGLDSTKDLIFHEMGHHVEYEDENIRTSAREWIKKRATGPQQKLNELVEGSEYDDNEIAYPDKFVSPYVGKDYGESDYTEVVSMGIEHLASSRSMVHLNENDPEHLAFTLGVIKAKRNV